MTKIEFSLSKLRNLMSESNAYQELSKVEKDNIEEHIRANNKPVLLYVFNTLVEEQLLIDESRRGLAEKLEKMHLKQDRVVRNDINNRK